MTAYDLGCRKSQYIDRSEQYYYMKYALQEAAERLSKANRMLSMKYIGPIQSMKRLHDVQYETEKLAKVANHRWERYERMLDSVNARLEMMDEKTHISSATCGRSSGAVLQEAVPSVVREETQ